MNNADLGGRRKVRSGRQTIFNSVAQPQPAAWERMMIMVPMMSSPSVHGKYVKCGSLVRSSAGGLEGRAGGLVRRSHPGLQSPVRRRLAEGGSSHLVRFFQLALDFWADASDHLNILPAELTESTRSHRSARRGPSSSME